MQESRPDINIVIPLYNESQVFNSLIERLDRIISKEIFSIKVILVDDGSQDGTTDMMISLSQRNENYKSVLLSRNFGHQLALTAGLKYVEATMGVMVIDGDLQDPPELIAEFYDKMNEGYDVIYAIRQNRKESVFKKASYYLFYRLLRYISYIDVALDSGDFCMMTRRIVDVINRMPEESRFIRGMRSWVGFKQVGISYDREARESGESKYTLNKLIALSLNGIFNFSEVPIKLLTRAGVVTIASTFLFLGYTVFARVFMDTVPDGFTSLLLVVFLFGGIQLLALGLMGEYMLRIFFQVKNRPLFIVDKVIQK